MEGDGGRERVLKLNLCTKRPLGKMLGCNPESGSITIVPLWCPNFMQKVRKN